MRQRKMCKGQQMKAITADSRGSCMNLLNADAAAAAHCHRAAAAASAAVNSSCRFSCTKKRGLERARHYRRACRCPSAAIAPAPSYKVKAASYDNILLRRCTGARKPALPMREAWPFINRQPDHRKTRFYTWQSSVVARLLQRSAQKSDPTVPGFSWVFDRACTSSPADLIVTFSC